MRQKHYQVIDVARGFAILMMFIYHICFDLSDVKIVIFHFNKDPFWLNFRTLIVSTFLFLMGVSLSIATSRILNRRRYLKRLLLLGIYASLVSIFSYLMFPKSMIFFGILHFILVASVLSLAFIRLYWGNLLFGITFIVFGNYQAYQFFDQYYLQWFGLMSYKPYTEDYVPLLPWFGVVLLGLFFGKLLFINKKTKIGLYLKQWSSLGRVPRILALGGRHSLLLYMVHQPVFMGLTYLLALMVK